MNLRNRAFLECAAVLIAATAAGLAGCQSGSEQPIPGDGHDFISDNPQSANNSGGEEDGGTATGGEAAPSAGDDNSASDPERAISEADIIQIHENKLYALSQYGGLSIIDISVPDQLTLLGRYAGTGGTPFEMYFQDGVVYAMFNAWGEYVWDAANGTYEWAQSSHIEALDVDDPGNVVQLGSFNLPGAISDSRIVGDVLYAVTYENGYCWDCNNTPTTAITSLRVGNPASIAVADQLTFSESDPYGYGWKRSVSATAERMYVAGVEWDGNGEGHSTIQIVDISDPQGDLVLGASVEAAGQIENRWQMDEHEGVLRVISQPGIWWSDSVPAVQTFTVTSSQSIQPLGYLDLVLPMPETLRSVRFDGERGYAITAEQTDPLFTIDLSNPAQPVQMGELVMPGWVYHMEPRGNRIIALGFDNADPEGSLNVSLFDVSDMSNPTMIKRVGFGGDWANLAEDQDRIHKAFTILDDQGLILVPYAGWDYDSNGYCGSYQSGIQLVDFTQNSLTKRGIAESRGQARRAFLHGERLFAVSDDEVRTFDIDNRSAPQQTASKTLATISNQSVQVGDMVARLSADWWTSAARIELVPAATPDQAAAIGSVDLGSVTSSQGCYSYGLYNARLFANGQHVYLVWPNDMGDAARVLAVDVTNPQSPTLAGQTEVPLSPNDLWGYYGPIVTSGDVVVKAGNALVFRRTDAQPYYYGYDYPYGPMNPPGASTQEAWLEVVDLSNPGQPTHSATVALPEASGHTPLRVDGSTVLLSHWVPLPEDDTKARFYLDRVNLTVPGLPVVLQPVNVPGSLVSFDGSTGRLLTVDYQRLTQPTVSYEECYTTFGYDAIFEPIVPDSWTGPGICRSVKRSLKLAQIQGHLATLLDSHALEDGTSLSSAFVGEDRVFFPAQNQVWYDVAGPYWTGSKLFVVGGMNDGALAVEELSSEELGYASPVAVHGNTLLSTGWAPTGLWTLDASDLDNLAYEQKAELRGYVNHITVVGDKALCSLGSYGLETVDLAD
ncbi:beta-propeller domain-containing protein [Chondromyces apiculatus]|uniref:Uncharacterized protein n=1 Tax=Chondromyces apiculatus DSM 436 TaxID=1192034 RepID=A0A017T2G5_9BACT|nr:beta-propeller domain-containing protein [Chondromyces apiculatus]EYF03428.1 Hypothetical protein CAP_5621 [Chondromyces apiculatus DSM 436]